MIREGTRRMATVNGDAFVSRGGARRGTEKDNGRWQLPSGPRRDAEKGKVSLPRGVELRRRRGTLVVDLVEAVAVGAIFWPVSALVAFLGRMAY